MARKKYVLIPVFFFLLNTILISVNAEEVTRNVEIDSGNPGPEFIIHWDYGNFLGSDTARADTVVNFIENAAREAWQKPFFVIEA